MYQLILSFIFAIQLFIHVVPSSAVENGLFEFGRQIRNERLLGAPKNIRVRRPRPQVLPESGSEQTSSSESGSDSGLESGSLTGSEEEPQNCIVHEEVFSSPRGERIYRVVAQSWLRRRSLGEVVEIVGVSPERNSVTLRFVSKPLHGLYFSVYLYGRA